MKKLYIWWTNQDDAESVTAEQIAALPEYIKQEFESRLGRSGRGRLWVAKQFSITGITWNDESLAASYCGESGGIVIHAEHLDEVSALAGKVTDLEMNLITKP